MAIPDPSLLGALLIALVCGWAARRLLRRPQGVFACMVLGVAGTLLGLAAAGVAGLTVPGAPGLAAAALGGAIFIQSALVLLKRR